MNGDKDIRMFASILTVECVQKYNNVMTTEDIKIGDDTFALLNTDHLQYLKQKGFFHAVVSKK